MGPEAIVVLLWIFAVLICDLRTRIIGWFSSGAIVGFLGCLAYAVRSTSFISILGIGVFALLSRHWDYFAELQNKEAYKALVDSADELKTRLNALEKAKAESVRTYDDQVNGLRSKLKKEVAAHATTRETRPYESQLTMLLGIYLLSGFSATGSVRAVLMVAFSLPFPIGPALSAVFVKFVTWATRPCLTQTLRSCPLEVTRWSRR